MQAVPFDVDQFLKAGVAVCAVVRLATQPPGVLLQVVLRPDKVSRAGLLRLGDTRGDEARCWISPEHVQVVEVLGRAFPMDGNSPDSCEWVVREEEKMLLPRMGGVAA